MSSVWVCAGLSSGILLCISESGTPLVYVIFLDLMAHHGLGLHPCPPCNKQTYRDVCPPHHTVCVCTVHHCELGLNFTTDRQLTLLVDGSVQFGYIYQFSKLFKFRVNVVLALSLHDTTYCLFNYWYAVLSFFCYIFPPVLLVGLLINFWMDYGTLYLYIAVVQTSANACCFLLWLHYCTCPGSVCEMWNLHCIPGSKVVASLSFSSKHKRRGNKQRYC